MILAMYMRVKITTRMETLQKLLLRPKQAQLLLPMRSLMGQESRKMGKFVVYCSLYNNVFLNVLPGFWITGAVLAA